MTAPSPHYVVRDHKRHSLYGTDDRIVLDLGSACWKVGFSGEANPRRVLFSRPQDGPAPAGIWEVEFEDVARGDGRAVRWWQRWETWEGLDVREGSGDAGTQAAFVGLDEEALDASALREVGEQMVDLRIGDRLKDVYDHHLMTDPKSRKVIVLENPLMPTRIKEMIARRLFEDFRVPSISFYPPQLLALFATGRTTGLVVDVGHLETVHLSRPLYPLLASSPLASRHLLRTLYILLLHFGAYVPPVSTLSAAAALGGPPGRAREASRIPRAALRARGVLDRILNEGCFVGLPRDGPGPDSSPSDLVRINSPRAVEITTAAAATDDLDTASLEEPLPPLPPHLADLHARFAKTSSARPLRLAVPASAGGDLVGGTIIVPGWVRERVAEELVAGRATDDRRQEREEQSVVELVLSVLEKLPIDLRVPLASSILVAGGTAHLPGFIPRLRLSLLTSLATPSAARPTAVPPGRRPGPPHPHQSILPLGKHIAILNDPTPEAVGSVGSAPAFAPSLLAWVGGSLAGSLRAGAKSEVTRERWDDAREIRRKRFTSAARGTGAADSQPGRIERDEEVEWEAEQWTRAGGVEVLGDWTRNGLGGPQTQDGVSAVGGPLATATAVRGTSSRR